MSRRRTTATQLGLPIEVYSHPVQEMWARHGKDDTRTCGGCVHVAAHPARTHWVCALHDKEGKVHWSITSPACGKFEARGERPW